MTIAVFDIDGVVADVRHRVHHVEGGRKDWPAFFRSAARDLPLVEGIALVHDLAESHDIVWLTGRPAWLRDVTSDWLAKQGLPATELHLRPNADRRPARLYKLGVLTVLRPRGIAAFIDDDDEVIKAASAAGFPAVLADWVPRGLTLREAQDRLGRS